MNPDRMRMIDRWLGTPLCLLLTLYRRLRNLRPRRPRPQGPPRRILFIELAEIGGLVVAYPCLAHARRRFPRAELYFLTFQGGQGILDLMEIIDRDHQIIIRPHGLLSLARTTLAALLRLRRLGIDATVNLEGYARFSTLLAFLSGARRRVGYHPFHEEGHNLGDLITHKVIYNPHLHAAHSFISLVEALAQEPAAEPRAKLPVRHIPLQVPRVETGPEQARAIRAKLAAAYPGLETGHKLVLLNPNASDLVAARRWPLEYFLQLGRGLLEDEEVVIVLTGTEQEREAAEILRRALDDPRVVNLAGKTSLAELIHLYNQARLLVTNDSGPAHFASLTRLKVLVLFGPETPAIYGPLGPGVEVVYRALACSPCVSVYNQKRSPCSDNRCLKDIEPEEILERARRILQGQD